jgi:hypothetical protein
VSDFIVDAMGVSRRVWSDRHSNNHVLISPFPFTSTVPRSANEQGAEFPVTVSPQRS